MIAHASMLRSSRQRRSIAHVRYQAPADLLPWADPYIASLFAAEEEARFDFTDASLDESDEEPIRRLHR